MRGIFATACLSLAAFAACGGPLDRRDGAISIVLMEVPVEVDSFQVLVRAGGRDFSADIPRRGSDVIDEFSAVPIGPALITVRAMVGAFAVASRVNIPVEVIEGQTQVVHVPLASGPEVQVISPEAGAHHRISAGPIAVIVEAVDPQLPTDLSIRLGDQDLALTADAGRRWSASIDPHQVAPVLPATITINIVACAAGSKTACTTTERTVRIERTLWSAQFPLITARPSYAPGVFVFGDREGKLRIVSAEDGTEKHVLALAGPLRRATVVANDLAIAVDNDGVMHAISVATGAEVWSRALGHPRPTRPVFDTAYALDRLVIGAGRRLLSIDTALGGVEELAVMSATITAAPLADANGLVAGDSAGEVLFFDVNGSIVDRASIGAKVVVQPIRDGESTLIFDELGGIHRLHGNDPLPQVQLSPQPIHDPVRAGAAIAVAHGDRLTFIRGSRVLTVPAGGSITFAPIPAPIGGGVLIGINQPPLIKSILESGEQRVVSRMDGPPLSGILLDAPPRLLAPANTGALQLFELEEGFF